MHAPLTLPSAYVQALEEYCATKDLAKLGAKRFSNAVSRITLGLRDEEQRFEQARYMKNEEIRTAYLFYYSTANLLKVWPPLRELALSGFFTGRDTLQHLDLGSGPGTALWGLASYLQSEQAHIRALHSHATDAVEENLRTIERFASYLRRNIRPLDIQLHTSKLDLTSINRSESRHPSKHSTSAYDLITMMNVLAEIEEAHDDAIIEYVSERIDDAGAILMIEPSRKEESRRALRFRDRMVHAGFHVYAPCCRTGGCPALEEEDNWCHTEVRWQRPDFIKAIDDQVGTLRLSLKSTYAIFTKQAKNISQVVNPVVPSLPGVIHNANSRVSGQETPPQFYTTARVVSERFDEKGRVRMFLCNEDGRNEHILNKRDKSPANTAALKVERYDMVSIENVEKREFDVKIGKESTVHTLLREDGCEIVDNLS